MLVNIHDVNTSTVADFKPPMQYPYIHRDLSGGPLVKTTLPMQGAQV